MTEAYRCKKLAQGHYAVVPSQDSNPRPVNRKSVALPTVPPRHPNNTWVTYNYEDRKVRKTESAEKVWRLTLKEDDANGREDDANPADSDWNVEDCDEQPGRTKLSLIANITRSALRRSSSTSSIYRRQLSVHIQHIIGHFGDESFQAINFTGIDNRKQGHKTPHTPETLCECGIC